MQEDAVEEDDEYIVFHREEIELDLPEEVKEFTKEMKVTDIGLWVDGENTIIVDYMINPEESDEILAVKFNSNLEFVVEGEQVMKKDILDRIQALGGDISSVK